eukprot:TRINITY_DN3174_c3_g1_i1.p1 TRINITY_DN3174_c3_g1~~TRINITY_DN3174_c3_g1_i1.p1  ORF type:complete len:498 (+),score=28.30 TRINITY_DN3174_c3_g1_i1:109-1602(+)
MTVCLTQLPQEILLLCFEYADYVSLCYSIPISCKVFRDVCSREILWLLRAKSVVIAKEIHVKNRLRQGMPYSNMPHPVKDNSMRSCVQHALLTCYKIPSATVGMLSEGTEDTKSKTTQLRQRNQLRHLQGRPQPTAFGCRQHLLSLQMYSQRVLMRSMFVLCGCTFVSAILYLFLELLDSDPVDFSTPLSAYVVVESWLVGSLLCAVLSTTLSFFAGSRNRVAEEGPIFSVKLQDFDLLGQLVHPTLPMLSGMDTLAVFIMYSLLWHAWAWGVFHSVAGVVVMMVPLIKFIVTTVAGNLLCCLLSFALGCGLTRQMDPAGFRRGVLGCERILAVLILSVFCAPAALLVARLMRHSSIPWVWQQLSDVLLGHMENPSYWFHCASSFTAGLVFVCRPRLELRNICEKQSFPSLYWSLFRMCCLACLSSSAPSFALPVFLVLNAADIILIIYQWNLSRKSVVVWRCQNCHYWDYIPPQDGCCEHLLGDKLVIWKDRRSRK